MAEELERVPETGLALALGRRNPPHRAEGRLVGNGQLALPILVDNTSWGLGARVQWAACRLVGGMGVVWGQLVPGGKVRDEGRIREEVGSRGSGNHVDTKTLEMLDVHLSGSDNALQEGGQGSFWPGGIATVRLGLAAREVDWCWRRHILGRTGGNTRRGNWTRRDMQSDDKPSLVGILKNNEKKIK